MRLKVTIKSLVNWFFLFGALICLIFLSSVAVAGSPDGITASTTAISHTGATLNGLVNPNNENTNVTFEYSSNSNLDSIESPPVIIAAAQSPLTGYGYQVVSADLSGLTPGTRYYFRVISVNGTDSDISSSGNFSTNLIATVTTDDASPVDTGNATLNGTVNSYSISTTVSFEYGLSTAYGTTVTADQSPVSGASYTQVNKAVPGLTPNSTYHFRVVANNAAGTVYGERKTFFTSAQYSPTVTTDDAEYSYNANTATLNGWVNGNNNPATVTFEYGLTTAYGTTVTADQSPITGSTDKTVSKYISGLTPDTAYHYRVVATNGIGTTNGADMTFFNTVAPYAKTNTPSNIGIVTATLNGTVNPKRFDDANDTTVTFEWGLTTDYGNSVTPFSSPLDGATSAGVSYTFTDLIPNTTYHYRIVADNPNGNGTGDDMTFTTSSRPTVDTLTATPVGNTTATLNGTVNSHNDSAVVTFEYGLTPSYGSSLTAEQSPVTSVTDTAVSKALIELEEGRAYHYRVVAINSNGTSYGPDVIFTPGVSPPSATTNAASAVGNSTATLNATVNAKGASTTIFFEYGPTASYGKTESAIPYIVTGSSNTAVSGLAGALIPNSTYHYRVVAVNNGGTIYGADTSFTTAAVPTVATDVATNVTSTGATLSGTVNANDDSSTVTFEYGTTTAYGTMVTADQSPVTGSNNTVVSKTISSLTNNTTYHFRVGSSNSSGTSYGEDMTFFTSTPAVAVVTTDAATMVVSSGATLNATANASNADTAVTFEYGTTVAYGTTVTADQSPVVGAINTLASKSITGLSNNTTYHYRVVGQNSEGTTNGSDMTFTTNALTPSAITQLASEVGSGLATLNGLANGNIAGATVTFEYGLTTAYGTSVNSVPSSVPGDSTSYQVSAPLSGLTGGTTYHFRVVADNIFVSPVNGVDMTFTTGVAQSSSTHAATAVTATGATLNGTVNSGDGSTTVTFEYGLDTNYGKFVSADQSPVTGNTDTVVSSRLNDFSPNTTYHYRVIAEKGIDLVNGGDMTFTTSAVSPTATTGAATGKTTTGFTLRGTANANNDSTAVTFEYGLTTAYGTTVTADQSPLTGMLNTGVSVWISGPFTAGTTYHYRVVAQSATGTGYGQNSSFTIIENWQTVTTNRATHVTSTEATLNGLVNANGNATVVTFEYGPDTDYGRTVTADNSPVTGNIDTTVTYILNDLKPDFTYHFRVVGQSGAGTVYGEDQTFTATPSFPWIIFLPALESPKEVDVNLRGESYDESYNY